MTTEPIKPKGFSINNIGRSAPKPVAEVERTASGRAAPTKDIGGGIRFSVKTLNMIAKADTLKPKGFTLPSNRSVAPVPVAADIARAEDDHKVTAQFIARDEENATHAPMPPVVSLTTDAHWRDAIVLDPSQQRAVDELMKHQFGCITGAAGTGKTTIERRLVRMIEKEVGSANLANYGKVNPDPEAKPVFQPLMAFAAYTGKASQQMKKALPSEYHTSVWTIHRLLGFHPEWWEDAVVQPDGSTKMVNKPHFIPLYNETVKMPWEVIFLDEASMIPTDLWNKFIVACKPTCRIYLIGDINQLPPITGKSVFGFALLHWPSFELTTIHRQKKVDGSEEENPIVENAWKILRGMIPSPSAGKFDMVKIDIDQYEAHSQIKKIAIVLNRKGQFLPYDHDDKKGDMLAVPQNVGMLGQEELNQALIPYFNPPPAENASDQIAGRRDVIIAGWEKKLLAIGDKVMVTMNDYDLGVTNGMTGKIIDIVRNGNYTGKIIGSGGSAASGDDLLAALGSANFGKEDDAQVSEAGQTEDKRKRQASHVVTVDFGLDEDRNPIHIEFRTAGQVNSLMHAYAATVHKLQGSEAPTVVVVCHQKNSKMLCREWLYTAVTRPSERCVLLYTDLGLTTAINRQRITGRNLAEKARSFNAAQEDPNFEPPLIPKARTMEELKAHGVEEEELEAYVD